MQVTDLARLCSALERIDQNFGLMMYVENWCLKAERNGRLTYKRSLVDTAFTDLVVMVAACSDGSIEDIVLNRSSGRPELDEAIRRIIRLNPLLLPFRRNWRAAMT